MQTAYLYVRVSTDEQAVKGYSMRSQEECLVKFCRAGNIFVTHTIREDYSAKTFNRPEWKGLLKMLNQKKAERPDLILFTRWDRFSRNAGDAYYMISLLRKMNIEVQAVEQMLDLSIPENKLVLALYLAVSEVENDRRALNIKKALHKARREGRWIGPAPKGYINRSTESGKKFIAPVEPDATIIRNIYMRIGEGDISIREAHRMAVDSGLKCSLNNFWRLIRNPVYCGKIEIPEFENEPGAIVSGNHEGLVSESIFEKVQDVLRGRTKKKIPSVTNHVHFPFKGILICPLCKRMLTGSVSKGHTKYYAYYHCYNGCKFRIRASKLDKQFGELLRGFKPSQIVVDLFQIILRKSFEVSWKDSSLKQDQITRNIEYLFNRSIKAKELFLKGEIDEEDFKVIKADCEDKIRIMGKNLQQTAMEIVAAKNSVKKEAFELLNMLQLYSSEDPAIKHKLVRLLLKEDVIPGENTFAESATMMSRLLFMSENVDSETSLIRAADIDTTLNYDDEVRYYHKELIKETRAPLVEISPMFWAQLPQIVDFLKKIASVTH